ncbi:hypothetical protein K439DRAFT_1617072 [Ramaria rubella]|nr:hypothetical protein K439DRAFT_1617072 [Ramaria rubella]
MDFTNINDPAGVKALLDQLRASQAWQDLSVNLSPSDTLERQASGLESNGIHNPLLPRQESVTEINTDAEPDPSPHVSNHISSLLSRLQPGIVPPPPPSVIPSDQRLSVYEEYASRPHHHEPRSNVLTLASPSIQSKPPRSITFSQALPIIARLSENPTFIEKLEKMYQAQAHLERKLWEERDQILKNQEDKVKIAQAKAAIIGSEISRNDATMLESLFLKEVKTYDSEQALSAWDALVTKQQIMLEALGVPGMFVSAIKSDREKQQRIIQVLAGLCGPEDDEDMGS